MLERKNINLYQLTPHCIDVSLLNFLRKKCVTRMHNVRAETLTGGLNNSITAILPYTPTSFTGRRPSGVTTYISIRVFLAIIKFKSSGDVKLPEI